MKKNILALGFSVGIALTSLAQDCPANSTFIQASCVSGCYQIIVHPSLSPVKPTLSQALAIKEDLNRRCSTFNGAMNIDQPGTITN